MLVGAGRWKQRPPVSGTSGETVHGARGLSARLPKAVQPPWAAWMAFGAGRARDQPGRRWQQWVDWVNQMLMILARPLFAGRRHPRVSMPPATRAGATWRWNSAA